MTVRELIMALLDEPLDAKIVAYPDGDEVALNFQVAPKSFTGGEIRMELDLG